jgi:hypothetical protein
LAANILYRAGLKSKLPWTPVILQDY